MKLAALFLLAVACCIYAIRLDGVDLILLSNDEYMIETSDKKMFAAKLAPSIDMLERTLLQTSVEGYFHDENTFFVSRINEKLTRQNPRPTSLQTGLDKRVLIVFVDSSDKPGFPNMNVTLLAQRMASISDYYFSNSYGRLKFANITIDTNLYRVSGTFSTTYATNAQLLMSHARSVVTAQSIYNPSAFNFFIIAFKYASQYSWAGLGSVGASSGTVWLNDNYAFNVITHEMGHNVGLNHANRLNSISGSPFGAGTTRSDYGDPFDVMGNTASGHVNVVSKRILGYLSDPANVRTINVTGTYELFAHDNDNNGDKLVGLRIRHNTASNNFVMVNMRSLATNQHMLAYGALEFHMYYSIYDGTNSTDFINANYIGGNLASNMYPLRVGFKFCDPSSNPMYCVFFERLNCANTPCSAIVTVSFVTSLPTPDVSQNSITWTYFDVPLSFTTHKFSTNTRWNMFFQSPYADMFHIISNSYVSNSHNSPLYALLSTSQISGLFLFSNSVASGTQPYTIQTATSVVTGITLTRTRARTYSVTYTPAGSAKNFYLLWNDMLVNSTTTLGTLVSLIPTATSWNALAPSIPGLHSVIGLALDTTDTYRTSTALFYYEELIVPTFTLVTKVVNNAWAIELTYSTPPAGNAIFYTTVFTDSLLNRFNAAPINAIVINYITLQMTTPAAATSNRIHLWQRYTLTASTMVDFEYSASSACSSITFGLKNSALSPNDRGIFYNVAGTACSTCKSINPFTPITGGWVSARVPVGLLDFATKGGNQYAFVVFETTGASCVLQVNNLRWYETLATINSAASNTVSTRDLSTVFNLQSASTQVAVPTTGNYTISLSPPGLNVTKSYTVYVTQITGTTSISATLEPSAISPTPGKSVIFNSASSITANVLLLVALIFFLL